MQLDLLLRESADVFEIREAMMRPATFDATARTIEAVIATNAPIARRDERGQFFEVLDVGGADLAALRGASVLDAHRRDGVGGVLGTVDDVWREGPSLIARLRLSSRPEVAAIIEDVRQGVLRHVSVGYQVAEWRDGIDAAGRRTRTATKWTPREVSFVPVAADPAAHTRAETSRRSINNQIRTLARTLGVSARVVDDLIDREATIENARASMLDDLITRGERQHVRTAIGTDYNDPDLQSRAIGDAIYSKMAGTAPTGQARSMMHMSMIDMMAHHCRAVGIPLRSNSPADVYAAAMQGRALHTTSDFPIILSDTMNKRLGDLFRAAETGASAIIATGTARDFRPITEARLTSFPSLEPLGESGEIKWGTMSEEGETLAIASYARAIGVTFNVLVNDDLGAIDRSVRDVAFATAALKRKLIVAALDAVMSDDNPLFHADHANLAPSGAVPNEASLSEGRLALMKQTAPGSTEPLGLSPAIFLVPAELQTDGEKLMAAINPASSSDVNVFSGKLQIAVEPGLTNDWQWFLFAAPGTYPVIRFLTLAGYEAPRFETENEFSRLGTSYRVHWHCGAGPVDWRGAWKNDGVS